MKDKPLYHTVADRLVRQIDEGKYSVGSRLPAERELAEQFGVSRVTIREAEIALQAMGRITIKTGSGVYVEDSVSVRDGEYPTISAFELTEARALFESEAAALAAERMTDENFAELEGLVEVMSTTAGGDQAGEAADHKFHHAIAAASGNTAILHLIESMWRMRDEIDAIKKVYVSICSEDFGARGREHSDILDALRERDPAAARKAMREHFRRLITSMLDVTHEQEMEDLRKKSMESRNRYLKNASI